MWFDIICCALHHYVVDKEKLIVCAFYNQATEAELERTTEEKQRQLRMRWQKRGQMMPSERDVV